MIIKTYPIGIYEENIHNLFVRFGEIKKDPRRSGGWRTAGVIPVPSFSLPAIPPRQAGLQ